MADNSPEEFLDVQFEDISVRLHRGNTSLYTFWGANCLYDHVYVDLSPEEVPGSGEDGAELRVFANEQGYKPLVTYIETFRWPRCCDLLEVPAEDVEAFYDKQMLYLEQGLGDTPNDGIAS